MFHRQVLGTWYLLGVGGCIRKELPQLSSASYSQTKDEG